MADKLDNLKPFEKGQSGNPTGRPKGKRNRGTIARLLLDVEQNLKNPLTGENELMSQEYLSTLALLKKARDGDVYAYKALMDSAYGSPVQQIDQTIEALTEIKVTIVKPNEPSAD